MKEFAYIISAYRKGKLHTLEVKIEDNKVNEFLTKIAYYKELQYPGYIKLTLLYIQDMETLEKEYIHTEIFNELKITRERKTALFELNGKEIEPNAIMGYLNYSTVELTNVIYEQLNDYNFILESNEIRTLSDIEVDDFIVRDNELIFHNKDMVIIAKLKITEKEWWEN